jgi:hypothetical protein
VALVEAADQVAQGGQGVVVIVDGGFALAFVRFRAVAVEARLGKGRGAQPYVGIMRMLDKVGST